MEKTNFSDGLDSLSGRISEDLISGIRWIKMAGHRIAFQHNQLIIQRQREVFPKDPLLAGQYHDLAGFQLVTIGSIRNKNENWTNYSGPINCAGNLSDKNEVKNEVYLISLIVWKSIFPASTILNYKFRQNFSWFPVIWFPVSGE